MEKNDKNVVKGKWEAYESILFMNNIEDAQKTEEYEIIQDMLYNEDPPDESALNFKNLGNEEFQKKDFKKAREFYKQGLQVKKISDKMKIQLTSNKSQCEYNLSNYGKCIEDSKFIIELDKNHIKSYFRIIKSCIELEKFDEGKKYLKLFFNFENKESIKSKIKLFKNLEKTINFLIKKKKKKEELKKISPELKICIDNKIKVSKKEEIGGIVSDISQENNSIFFKTLLLYDEFGQSDLIGKFELKSTFYDVLDTIFPPNGPPFPFGGSYGEANYYLNNIEIYYYSFIKKKYIKFDKNKTFLEILTREDYQISNHLTPIFHILSKNSKISL